MTPLAAFLTTTAVLPFIKTVSDVKISLYFTNMNRDILLPLPSCWKVLSWRLGQRYPHLKGCDILQKPPPIQASTPPSRKWGGISEIPFSSDSPWCFQNGNEIGWHVGQRGKHTLFWGVRQRTGQWPDQTQQSCCVTWVQDQVRASSRI